MFKKRVVFKKGVPGDFGIALLVIILYVAAVLLGGSSGLLCICIAVAALLIYRLYFAKIKLDPADLIVFWGLPRSGKTLCMTKTLFDNREEYMIGVNQQYSHLTIKDFVIDKSELATYNFGKSVIAWDEASLNGFDNRDWATNFKESGLLETFKLHGQMDMPILITNQGFEECDNKIRGPLASHVYYCEDLGRCCRATLMMKDVSISEITGAVQEGFRFPTFWERLIDPSKVIYAWKHYHGRLYSTQNPPVRNLFPAVYDLICAGDKRTSPLYDQLVENGNCCYPIPEVNSGEKEE